MNEEVKWSEVAQSCPTHCDPTDCSLPGFSVHGIFQARVLAWVAISFSKNMREVVPNAKGFITKWIIIQNFCLLPLTLKFGKLWRFSHANLRTKYFPTDCPLKRFIKNCGCFTKQGRKENELMLKEKERKMNPTKVKSQWFFIFFIEILLDLN